MPTQRRKKRSDLDQSNDQEQSADLDGVTIQRVRLSTFRPAQKNPNKANQHSIPLIEESIQTNGAGRPMLADKHGEMLGGSQSIQAFVAAGFTEAILVKGNRNTPIIFQREDVDIDTPEGRSIQVGDNVIGQKSFTQDDQLTALLMAQMAQKDDQLVKAAGFSAADVRHLTAIVDADIRGIQKDEVPNNRNSNLGIMDREGSHTTLNWRDIMVLLPREVYDRAEAYIEREEHESRGAAMQYLIECGLAIVESEVENA